MDFSTLKRVSYEPDWAYNILSGNNKLLHYGDFPVELVKNINNGNYVYIMSYEEGTVKVGYSYDPYTRVKSLQTGWPHKLVVNRYFGPFFLEDARKIESAVHDYLRHCALVGEWFAISVEDAEDAVEHVIKNVPNLLYRINTVIGADVVDRFTELVLEQSNGVLRKPKTENTNDF